MSRTNRSIVAVFGAIAMLALPALSFAQRGPGTTDSSSAPTSVFGQPVIASGPLPSGKNHLSGTEARNVAKTAFTNLLTTTVPQEGRTIVYMRPAGVHVNPDNRFDNFCGVAVFGDQSDPARREVLTYSTMVWYLHGTMYAVTTIPKPKYCVSYRAKVKFKSRNVSSKKVAQAAVKKYLRKVYGKVQAVRLSGVKSHRARTTDFYRRAKVSFTIVPPDGVEVKYKDNLQLAFEGVNKHGVWRVSVRFR